MGSLVGQETVRTRAEENVRAAPQGEVIGRVRAGVTLLREAEQGRWSRVTFEGWMWTRSLRTTNREDFGLVVSAPEGENLRAEPSGEILARLDPGTVLEQTGSETGWTRVRRTAWIWSPSLAVDGASGTTTSVPQDVDPAVAIGGNDRFVRIAQGDPVLSGPDGDTLALSTGSGDLEVLAREGEWVRVRLEGWAWRPERSADDTLGTTGDDGGVAQVTPEDLTTPGGEAHVGRRVIWQVQFVSLERAESVRTDFFEGEPFILGRFGGPGGAFVYVAVPPERVDELSGLTPLEIMTVTGRIRRAASRLTRTPILDLLDLTRSPDR